MNYRVNNYVRHVAEDGTITISDNNFPFRGEDLLHARRSAIAKAKELLEEMRAGDFQTPEQAASRNHLGFKSMAITVFLDKGEESYNIYGGDEETQMESLQVEAKALREAGVDVQLELLQGEDAKVVGEDLHFLLN